VADNRGIRCHKHNDNNWISNNNKGIVMDKDAILKALGDIALKNLNIGGLMVDSLDAIIEPALDEMVKGSDNPYDDSAKAALYPILDKYLKEQIVVLDVFLKEKLGELVGGEDAPAAE
jgi:hypothetical protein